MTTSLAIAADLAAISVLAFALYFPRYQRKDMLVAILSLNVGVLAVATALSSSEVSAGLGLGLFGVLSIIRLRSAEIGQGEIAYYFSALALGLLAGFEVTPTWIGPALMVAILGALYVGDHPRLFPQTRQQSMQLDRAFTDEIALTRHVEGLLGAVVTKLVVKKVDLVNDTTSIDVRFRLPDRDAALRPESLEIGVRS